MFPGYQTNKAKTGYWLPSQDGTFWRSSSLLENVMRFHFFFIDMHFARGHREYCGLLNNKILRIFVRRNCEWRGKNQRGLVIFEPLQNSELMQNKTSITVDPGQLNFLSHCITQLTLWWKKPSDIAERDFNLHLTGLRANNCNLLI